MAHTMMLKALVGLEAAKKLRADAKLRDDATSRVYYALYHACWAFLQTRRPPEPFDKPVDYVGTPNWYHHNKLGEKLAKHSEFSRVVGNRWAQLLAKARSNRVKADYRPETVEAVVLDDLVQQIEAVVKNLRALC